MAATAPLAGIRKAAILLVVLGEEAASLIYQNLPERDLESLTHEISNLEHIDARVAVQVLREYLRLSSSSDIPSAGGREYANRLLVKAFGEEAGQRLSSLISHAIEADAGEMGSLRKADPQQLARFLEAEQPQTIALILAHFDARQASVLMMKLPDALRAETIKRMAQMRQFSPEIAQSVSASLNKRLQALGAQHRRAYAGVQGVADLLNRMDPVASKAVLESIERDDPAAGLSIRNLMFTFADLLGVGETAIRELLGHLEKKRLALALRGASEELKNYIFKCMSMRAVETLKEDMGLLGPVRSRDVMKAQQEAVSIARQLESEGRITLAGAQDDEYIS